MTLAVQAPSKAPTDPATLLWVGGDRAAALSLAFKVERRAMYAIARSLVGEEFVADVVQDVLLRVWRNAESFDSDRGSLGGYLRVLVRGVAIDRVRGQVARRHREDLFHWTDVLRPVEGLERAIDVERAERVRGALMLIAPEERTAIVAAFFEHRSYAATAAHLGIPEGTIKSRIRQGLLHLRVELRDLI